LQKYHTNGLIRNVNDVIRRTNVISPTELLIYRSFPLSPRCAPITIATSKDQLWMRAFVKKYILQK